MADPDNFNRALRLLERAHDHGERCAIEYEGSRITFAQLAQDVTATAAALRLLGVDQGCRVGLLVPSEPEFITVLLALQWLGATVSPLNIFYRPGELAHAIASCALDTLVLHADLRDRLPMALRAEPAHLRQSTLRRAILCGTRDDHPGYTLLDAARHRIAAAPPAPPPPAHVAGSDIAMLLNTSATTGKSKGVMLTAANLAANYDRTPEWLGIDGDDVILCALPLYNTFGLNQGINAMLVTGARLVLLPRFDAARCIDAIRRQGCTFMPAVPTMLQKIVDHPGLGPGALGNLRTIMTGGAPVPAPLLQRVLAATGREARVLTGYGLTEGTALVTLCSVTCNDQGELSRGKTIGRVLDGMDLDVMDDAGRRLPRGATGEFVVRGANVMAGYFEAPDDTAQALRSGWLHTGDIGLIDADGYAYIVDRKKDIIIRGGQNIYPADIEEAIYAVDGVAEAAVVAQDDEILGEVPVAFVALRAGATVSESAILQSCVETLASYKRPGAVHILPELPKGPTGKILRRELRQRLLASAPA